jgi:hypothetical protein
MRPLSLLLLLLLPLAAIAQPPKATPGNRLAYLDELDPYYPHAKFPKLITPQWVGEPDVDAVVILAIDDMREPKKYETFLRPILNRLKKIDGRAPVSIMTCNVEPKDAQLQAWLKEGLSLEVHTVDHPCPYFKPGFDKAKDTYDRGVDLLHAIPGNKPVAFRMPCCDSLNTPSPRHWAEIFNKTTNLSPLPPGEGPGVREKPAASKGRGGNYLSLDSSVFMVYTSDDPELPKELVLEDGKERFKKYLPMDREFVNWIENYPYPYVIGKYCWQFPCMTPSDWQAQHLHKSNNPLTVRDWKAALDCTVIKKGVFTMVFHPHGWIKAEQIIELIDHAQQKHGNKVKFLTFKEAQDRLQKALFRKDEWRGCADSVFLLDLNNDGYLDIVDLRTRVGKTYLWDPEYTHWKVVPGPDGLALKTLLGGGVHFGVLQNNGFASVAHYSPTDEAIGPERYREGVYHFNGKKWIADAKIGAGPPKLAVPVQRLIDFDGDGICEKIDGDGKVFRHEPGKDWQPLAFALPFTDKASLRFLDLNGKLDLVFSNEKEYGVYLFTDMKTGWKKLRVGKAGDPNAIPMIARNGKNNGCWAHSGQLWWANEDTVLLKNNVARRSFKELLEAK